MKTLLEALAVLLFLSASAFFCGWTERGRLEAAPVNLGNYPDCAKHPDFGVIVRSSVDRKYYFIQSCTVADSASGEDFRHEVPNKPCDVPESNCPKDLGRH
jgi:hypothetical protein